jgi:hypothetical protein
MRNRLLTVVGTFLIRAASVVVVHSLAQRFVDQTVFPDHCVETSRKTSPDGMVDAVMISRDWGAPCSTNYSVYIVPKGHQIEQKTDYSNFSADDVTGANLMWTQPRLLEVAYSRAFIIGFRNVAYPLNSNSAYRVEIRLAPTSQGFSYLTDSETQ